MTKNICTAKFQIFVISLIVLLYIVVLFPPIIIFGIVFFLKTDYEVKKVLQTFGIYDCIKKIFPGKEKKYENYINTFSSKIDGYKNKNKKIIKSDYVKIMSSDKHKLKQDYKINKRMNYTNSRISQEFIPEKTNKTSFNSGFDSKKSIWDDYESVIDKIKK